MSSKPHAIIIAEAFPPGAGPPSLPFVAILDSWGAVREVTPAGALEVSRPVWAHPAFRPNDGAERLRRAYETARTHGLGACEVVCPGGGAEVCIDVAFSRLQLDDPEAGLICHGIDATERRQRDIERDRVSQSLRESEARLREAQQVARLGNWELDLRSGHLVWSDEVYRIFEVDPARFGASYESFVSMVHPEDRGKLDKAYRDSVASRQLYSCQHRLLFPDGRIKHVHEMGRTFYAADGVPLRSIGTVQDITDRVRAEATLDVAQAAIDAAANGIILATMDGHLTYANRAAARIWNFAEPHEMIGRHLRDLVADPDDAGRCLRVSGERGSWSGEVKARQTSGAWTIVHVVASRVCRRDAGPDVLMASVVDTTDRRLAEDALRRLTSDLARLRGHEFFDAAAHHLLETLDASEVSILVHLDDAPPRHIGYASATGERARGARASAEVLLELTQGSMWSSPQDPPSADHANAEGQVREAEGLAVIGLFDVSGHLIGHIEMVAPVPAHDRPGASSLLPLFSVPVGAELERMRVERRFQDLFVSAPDAILFVSARDEIVDANRAAIAMFGYSRNELIGMHVDALKASPTPAGYVKPCKGVRSASTSEWGQTGVRIEGRRKDGTTFPSMVMFSRLDLDLGPVTAVLVEDRSGPERAEKERRDLERQLLHVQKMDAIGTLASGIAHDFNNVLTAIIGLAELAEQELHNRDQTLASLKDIQLAGSRATELVRQILTFSREQTGQRGVLHLGALAHEVVRLLRASIPAEVHIDLHADPDLPPIHGDGTQLHQVLVNLATNAWQAMDGRPGHIGISVTTIPSQLPDAEGPMVQVTVSDTGKGMDAAVRDRIFEPFFTTKDPGRGTGLGLSVVHGIVMSHGGAIHVDSAPGSGSVFTLLFPSLVGAPHAVSKAPAPSSSPTPAPGRVLFVDDEPVIADVAGHALRAQGHEVFVQTDPDAALELLRQRGSEIDVVVTDYNMPRQTGAEIARAASAFGIRVIVITGLVNQAGLQHLRLPNLHRIVAKPYRLEDLAALVSEAVRLGRQSVAP